MSKQEKSLHMTILMTPDMANFSGNVHGGAILKLLDQVAFACAARYCKSYVVTLSLDQVTFNQPIKVGELVSFRAHVNYVGTSSLEVGVKVFAENLETKQNRHTNPATLPWLPWVKTASLSKRLKLRLTTSLNKSCMRPR